LRENSSTLSVMALQLQWTPPPTPQVRPGAGTLGMPGVRGSKVEDLGREQRRVGSIERWRSARRRAMPDRRRTRPESGV
jgi:hypothetical protein